jgi:hypothetical protein
MVIGETPVAGQTPSSAFELGEEVVRLGNARERGPAPWTPAPAQFA